MKATVEPLEGNKVKLSVEIDEGEFEQALDAAFRKIAREVRIPGFRPGKAPRRLLEARLGKETARQEALRDSLPDYYARALKDAELDPIAPPEIDITAGEEAGPVAFDAVVEVRPQVGIPGYGGLRVTVPSPEVSDEDLDNQVDRLRNQSADLRAVDRPVQNGDIVTIDLNVGEDAYPDNTYEVGSGGVVPELDAQLHAAKVGDILSFESTPAGSESPVTFRVLVKDVKEKVLPEATDEWASEASEFETMAELRDDLRNRLSVVKKLQGAMALRDEAMRALVELVEEEVPEPLVNEELERRVHDLGHRLERQGATIAQYLEATGTSQEQLLGDLRNDAIEAVKADLALRALAEAEAIDASDDDIDAEIARLAERMGTRPDRLRQQLDRQEAIPTVRSDVRKAKALEWLVSHVEVVDPEGRPIDRADLTPTPPEVTQEGENQE
jgi:trigger factor